MKMLGVSILVFCLPLGLVAQDPLIRQDRRYLAVKNDTKEKLVIFVQYNTLVRSTKDWQWFPGEPQDGEAVAYAIPPGRKVALEHDDWPVNARCVRIWARSESGQEFNEYRARDLWLVERQKDGQRYYMAPTGETFTFTFGE
jgi:hypothetical protein